MSSSEKNEKDQERHAGRPQGEERPRPARIRSAVMNSRHFAGGRMSRIPKSAYVFTSERGAPFTTAGFARMVERAGVGAKLGFKAHPHNAAPHLRLCPGQQGHDTQALQAYLSHRNIQHTVRYTELAPDRFKDFWR